MLSRGLLLVCLSLAVVHPADGGGPQTPAESAAKASTPHGAATVPAIEGTPRAIVKEIGHDFGPVDVGGLLTHTFTIGSGGTAPLTILRVETSEPAMRTRFTSVIPPGTAGRITVEWDALGVSGDLDGHLVVHTSDPRRPRVTFTLSGTIVQSILVQPSPDVFVSLFEDEGAERRLMIVNNESRALNVTGLRPTGDHFTATLNTLEPGRKYEVLVKVPKGLKAGRHSGEIVVETDHPRLGSRRIEVNAVIKKAVYVTPEAFDFGDISLEKVHASETAPWLLQSAELRSRKGDFSIVSITSDVPGLKIDRSPAGLSASFGLVATLDRRSLQPGPIKGSIRIQTTNKEFPLVEIPVYGRLY
jgi:hypothetical protein